MRVSKVVTPDHEFFLKLAVLNSFSGGQATKIDRVINQRSSLMATIEKAKQSDGTMFVSRSGIDCDGSSYQYSAYKIEASVKAYYAEVDKIAEWADGPFHLSIHTNVNDLPESSSRDLALEAFEDGHQHVVFS